MMVGWAGLFAVNVLASDLKLQAAVSRASQRRRGEYHMHNPSQVGAVGLGVMGDGLSPILSSGTVQPANCPKW
jgi:hypothetical protein